MNRRDFIGGTAALAAVGFPAFWADAKPAAVANVPPAEDVLDVWQRETDQVSASVYEQYMLDGQTRGLKSLERLEAAFEKVLKEAREAQVDDVPAVWSVYNMGYVVKTRASMFAIDLVHRRAPELAPLLDFALVTHNHNDHWRSSFYRAMNGAGKTVVSNFLDNYGVRNWQREGGYVRGEKTLRLKDVEIRTSLVDHNGYLIDFTTAFEIRVGDWRLYHSGDCGNAGKLRTLGGRPDLWLFFPGCGVNTVDAVRKIGAKRTVFGHLWELGHSSGRLTTPLIRSRRADAASVGVSVEIPMWGTRIS